MSPLVVAIDGPAGAGKSTIAKKVAQRTGLSLVDTGAIYRALALASQRAGVGSDDGEALAALAASLPISFQLDGGDNRVHLEGEDVSDAIRAPEVSMLASTVSKHPPVRAALLDLQRELAAEGAVLEGRDIGTVVFPGAPVKIFLTASPEERARRRAEQLAEKGQAQPFDRVLADIVERDRQDQGRAVAPLKPAADAEIVDSTYLTEDEVVTLVARRVDAVRSGARGAESGAPGA